MTYLDAVFLGLLQGLTEFLPVSSSGHLVLGQHLLGVKQPGVAFEVLVHLGTLASVVVYFRRRLWRLVKSLYTRELSEERRIIGLLIVGTVPAVLAGLFLEDFFERAFSDPLVTSIMLAVTGLILLSTRFVRKGERAPDLKSSLIMGIGQALAIMPGISRSGTTISAGLLVGVRPSEAAEFSFLLAIPAIAGAALLEWRALFNLGAELAGPYAVATLLSFASGLLAVYAVLAVIRRGHFEYFAYYCFAAAALGVYLFV